MSNNRHWSSPPKTKSREEPDANGREGGDDSLVNSSPTDNRSDEKVVVNEQRSGKIVNGAPQTSADIIEGSSNDDEILE
jgi:hypothetical protein